MKEFITHFTAHFTNRLTFGTLCNVMCYKTSGVKTWRGNVQHELKAVVVVNYCYVTGWTNHFLFLQYTPSQVGNTICYSRFRQGILVLIHEMHCACLRPAPTYISSSSKPSRDKAVLPRTELPTLSYINCMVKDMWQRCACAEKFHSIHTF